MDSCAKLLEQAVKLLTPEERLEIKNSPNNFSKVREIVAKYVSRRDCLDVESVKRYVIKPVLLESIQDEDVIEIEVPLVHNNQRGIGKNRHMCFSFAELMYSQLFEENRSVAHVEMYNFLEPILTSGSFDRGVQRGLFEPISGWGALQRLVASLLSKLDESRKRTVCRTLYSKLPSILLCTISRVESPSVRLKILGRIVRDCPEIKEFVVRA